MRKILSFVSHATVSAGDFDEAIAGRSDVGIHEPADYRTRPGTGSSPRDGHVAGVLRVDLYGQLNARL